MLDVLSMDLDGVESTAVKVSSIEGRAVRPNFGPTKDSLFFVFPFYTLYCCLSVQP
jgi:hypothetical protein